jgi:hypothetical protein
MISINVSLHELLGYPCRKHSLVTVVVNNNLNTGYEWGHSDYGFEG